MENGDSSPLVVREVILWHLDPEDLPDDDVEVLLCAESGVGSGFRDAEVWRWQSADLVEVEVYGWAEMPDQFFAAKEAERRAA